jgi:NADH:ubiquinone oxidoreductase subunit 3 (subunit A)
MEKFLLSPPVAFVVLLAVSMLISFFSKYLAAKGTVSAGKEESYACGEDDELNKVQPDYSQFFPFAFFFTIMHVVVLIIATMPKNISPMAILYILIAVLALFILFRK